MNIRELCTALAMYLPGKKVPTHEELLEMFPLLEPVSIPHPDLEIRPCESDPTIVARAIMRACCGNKKEELLTSSNVTTYCTGSGYGDFADWILKGSPTRLKLYNTAQTGGLSMVDLIEAVQVHVCS